ncbi:MAG: adenylate/guanylate cyclase domain-containing protein [Candidatus Dojkabacteria bacterium]
MRQNFIKLLRKNLFSIVVISSALILPFVLQIPIFSSINDLLLDQLQGQSEARSEIVVVKIDDESLQNIGSWPWDRTVFATSIHNIESQQPAVLGFDVLFLESRISDNKVMDALRVASSPVVFGSKLSDNKLLKSVYDTSSDSGFVNFSPDSDGKIRSTKLFDNTSTCELSFASEIVKDYLQVNNKDLCDSPFNLRNSSIQIDKNNEARFSYTREAYSEISFKDVLYGNFEQDFFKNKIVLVGSTALDLRSNLNDNFTSIFGDNIPGILIHANIINTFLNKNFLYKIDPSVLLISSLVYSLIILFLFRRIKTTTGDTIAFVITFILNFIIGIFILNFALEWPIVESSIIIVVFYIATVIYRYLSKSQESRFVKGVFQKYLSPKLLGELIRDPEKLKLGGETREMSVLFSDIRSFTTISESLTPEQLINLLNDYLEFMSNVILNNNGTIDKYIGDAIMAIWGAPLTDLEHANNSVEAAMQMKESLEEFKKMYPKYPDINIGIGINSGEMVVGNVGGSARFDYTVLGDNVNLGSRLEGLTKKYGVTIIIAESTMKQVSESSIIFRHLDTVKVKGKDKPVKIYEPLRHFEANKDLVKKFNQGYNFYEKGEFKKAKDILEKLTEDKASHKLLERIDSLLANPPLDWKGVWTWDEK